MLYLTCSGGTLNRFNLHDMDWLNKLKEKSRFLKREIFALYLACRDPRVPWYAKVLVVAVVAYALSPIDLIPDFIPVLGYLDDLIIVPAGIYIALKLVPAQVMDDCRRRAVSRPAGRGLKCAGALMVIGLWIIVVFCTVWCVLSAR